MAGLDAAAQLKLLNHIILPLACRSCMRKASCRAVKGKDGESVPETELTEELQRLTGQMKAIDASIAAARSQLENLKKEDERTVWETNIVILKAGLFAHLSFSVRLCKCRIRTYMSPAAGTR